MRKKALIALTCAALSAPAHADTLVENIQGIRWNEEGKVARFTALWIDDQGRVKEILQNKDKRPKRFDYVVDGKGRFLIPSFVDSHVHIMGMGIAALTLDLSDTNSLAEAQAKIAEYAADNPGRPWILGRGWNQEKWGSGAFPSAADLDDIVPDKPVWLERVDGHAAWANSAAMSVAGVTAQSKVPSGGRMAMSATGAPSGLFVDAAMDMIGKFVPKPSASDRDIAFAKAQEILLENGITAAADMGTSIEDWQAFRRAGDKGNLRIRIMAYADGIEEMELIGGPSPTPWLYDDRLRLNGVKVYLDGALGSRGAWLKQPYTDDAKQSGLRFLTSAQLRNIISRASMSNFQVAIHAIGDAANAETIDAIAELAESYMGDRRWRIEHAQIMSPADITRLKSSGIIASMQPIHMASDWQMADKRLGNARLPGAYAWRSIQETGTPLAFGSDAPVESPNPFPALATALSRTDSQRKPIGGWLPDEILSRESSLAAFTYGGAYAGYAESKFSILAKGQWADFIILSNDPLSVTTDSLRDMKPEETWVAGRRAYARAN